MWPGSPQTIRRVLVLTFETNLPLEFRSFLFDVDPFQISLNFGWFCNVLLNSLAIISIDSSLSFLDSLGGNLMSLGFSANPCYGASSSVSSYMWISWVQSFSTRSSNLRVFRSWASSMAITLGPHLLLKRHCNIFLTISSLV